jgi:hypothetical protein
VSLSLGSRAWAVSAQRPPFSLGALAPDSDIHILLPHIVSAPHPVNQTRQEVGRCQGAHFPHSKREAPVQIHPQQGARICWAISDGQCRAVVGWSGFGNVQAESDPADWGRENTGDKECQGQRGKRHLLSVKHSLHCLLSSSHCHVSKSAVLGCHLVNFKHLSKRPLAYELLPLDFPFTSPRTHRPKFPFLILLARMQVPEGSPTPDIASVASPGVIDGYESYFNSVVHWTYKMWSMMPKLQGSRLLVTPIQRSSNVLRIGSFWPSITAPLLRKQLLVPSASDPSPPSTKESRLCSRAAQMPPSMAGSEMLTLSAISEPLSLRVGRILETGLQTSG